MLLFVCFFVLFGFCGLGGMIIFCQLQFIPAEVYSCITLKKNFVILINIIIFQLGKFNNVMFHQAASSLNSSYCYILQNGSTVFTWSGNLTTSEDQELAERQLDLIKVCCFELCSAIFKLLIWPHIFLNNELYLPVNQSLDIIILNGRYIIHVLSAFST